MCVCVCADRGAQERIGGGGGGVKADAGDEEGEEEAAAPLNSVLAKLKSRKAQVASRYVLTLHTVPLALRCKHTW